VNAEAHPIAVTARAAAHDSKSRQKKPVAIGEGRLATAQSVNQILTVCGSTCGVAEINADCHPSRVIVVCGVDPRSARHDRYRRVTGASCDIGNGTEA
jgi:hypothetical protein